MKIAVIRSATVLLCVAGLSPTALAQSTLAEDMIADEILVGVAPEADLLGVADRLADRHGLTVLQYASLAHAAVLGVDNTMTDAAPIIQAR